MSEARPARAYHQTHVPRRYEHGRRRLSVYSAWSYSAEANRGPRELGNRFSTMTEVRRVLWPNYETPQWADPRRFQQGIAGSLDRFFSPWVNIHDLVREVTERFWKNIATG
jgi:hypothetical protein